MIRQIIKEELENILKEQMHWHRPAEEEHSAYLNPSAVHEAGEKKKRPGIGKKKNKTGGEGFTSAGTIPPTQGRKLTDTQINNRKEIGKKMLNTLRRGGEAGRKFRERITGQLDNKGLPTDRMHQYSQIWANASAMAANGATASDFSKKSKKKKSKPSGETK